jgi:predicted nucleic acid-binding protein
MICTIDANALILWASPKTNDVTLARLQLLLETVAKAGGAIILPTPAVAELLIRTDEGTAAWLQGLQRRNAVRVAPFDLRAAAECAFIHRLAEKAGGKRSGAKVSDPYQKIKVDRQIAAIAKVANSDLLVTGDDGLIAVCKFIGLATCKVDDLDAPASALQGRLPFPKE